MRLSDLIEEYILEMLEKEKFIEIQRNELAGQFNCVPSQINYVISTRFNPERGFYVESRRGGGGNITIRQVVYTENDYINQVINAIGNSINSLNADKYIKEMLSYNIIDTKTAKLIKVAISDKILGVIENPKRDILRANIFKNMLINI